MRDLPYIAQGRPWWYILTIAALDLALLMTGTNGLTPWVGQFALCPGGASSGKDDDCDEAI